MLIQKRYRIILCVISDVEILQRIICQMFELVPDQSRLSWLPGACNSDNRKISLCFFDNFGQFPMNISGFHITCAKLKYNCKITQIIYLTKYRSIESCVAIPSWGPEEQILHSKFLRIYAFLSNTKIIIFKNIPLFTGNYIQNMQYICLRSGTYFNVSPMKWKQWISENYLL